MPAGRDGAVVLGGAGFVGSVIARELLARGRAVTVLDHRPPPGDLTRKGAGWLAADVLHDEVPFLPPGEVVLSLGSSDPRPRWPWMLPVSNALATARILPALAGRRITLLSSVEVYGSALAPLREDSPPVLPWTADQVDEWCDEAVRLAAGPVPPWRAAPLGQAMAQAAGSGRWVYALSKLAQERLVARAVPAEQLTILRLANICGIGQERVVCRLIRAAQGGEPLVVTATRRSFVPVREAARIVASALPAGTFNVGGPPVWLPAIAEEIRELCGSASSLHVRQPPAEDSCGVVDATRLAGAGHRVAPVSSCLPELAAELKEGLPPRFDPPLPVVIPPRAVRPDQVAARQQASLWSGQIKHGARWSRELEDQLAAELGLEDGERSVLVTCSGTSALRLVVAATAGRARPGDWALLPSFTFPATAEVLLQLGYQLRFADVDSRGWTLDPQRLRAELAAGPARLVVCVDAFGNPCDYDALAQVCDEAGVPLIADSAAALGSRYQGRPVATQAAGHAYSMSFAKVLSAGGAGGAAVLPAAAAKTVLEDPAGWWRSELMNELHAIYAVDQLAVLADMVRRRNQIAAIYAGGLSGLPGLIAQQVRTGDIHSYVHWVVRVPEHPGRDALQRSLLDFGIQTKPYFRAVHLAGQPGLAGEDGADGRQAALPVTAELDAQALALPASSEMTAEEAERVVIILRQCYLSLLSTGRQA
jgi:dTDP-4-amino-4,6-dideoxygalactose transaminase/nucleoside-diphosphate-sugar epimerase